MTHPTTAERDEGCSSAEVSCIAPCTGSTSENGGGPHFPETKAIVGGAFVLMHQYACIAGKIPAEDYEYYSAFPAFTHHVQQQSSALVNLMEVCFRLLPVSRRPTLGVKSSLLRTNDNHQQEGGCRSTTLPSRLGEGHRTMVMEAIDSMLENTDVVLDEVKGRKLRENDQLQVSFGTELIPSSTSDGLLHSSASANKESSSLHSSVEGVSTSSFTVNTSSGVARISRVIRPQLTFKRPVDNRRDTEFIPQYADEDGVLHTGCAGEHPFEATILAFQPPSSQLLPKPDIPYVPLNQCPLIFVDTVESLRQMVETLLQMDEVAVDLEHHDFYSFLGFTCLMQLSTRVTDYIVDCLRLRDEMKLLAPVFLNPRILKVFHGAKEDIRWLQKDFSLYVVNFFDTGIALQTLRMPRSLSFAVDHFCQVKLDKKYQTADWRIRPIPADMIHYARQDTHYLLYVYDRLKSMLLSAESHTSLGNLLIHVYQASKRLSLEKYTKPEFNPEYSYAHSLDRTLAGLNTIQRRVAQYVYNWRDEAAREVDDSPVAVLHQSSLVAIASKLPQTTREVLQCAHPISSTFRAHASKVAEFIRAIVLEEQKKRGSETSLSSSSSAVSFPASLSTSHRVENDGVVAGAAYGDSAILSFGSPMGIFRPMTGSLASISMPSMLHPSFLICTGLPGKNTPLTTSAAPINNVRNSSNIMEQNIEDAYANPPAILDTSPSSLPSQWLLGMRAIARCLERRPRPQVPLPGAHILEIAAKRYREAQERATDSKNKIERERGDGQRVEDEKADDKEEERVKKEKKESMVETLKISLASPEKVANPSELGPAPKGGNIEESNFAEDDNILPLGPFAMRQALGTGAKNRRQAKNVK